MKAAILTFHLAYNYGAVLQAYGLQDALGHMGVEAHVLDYRAPILVRTNRPLGLRTGRFMTVLPMRWRFDCFRKNHLNLTKKVSTARQLKRITSEYDAVIVGSDQVWNTNIIRDDLNYFIAFTDDVNKISYAADFGEFRQSPDVCQRISGYLSKFSHISVRTKLSSQILHNICGREAEVVLDPTFLCDYSEINADVCVNEPYILVYGIWEGATRDKLISAVASVKSYYKIPVYSISQYYDFPLADIQLRGVGPKEWLAYFRNAAFICTDSYHGSVFSIKNRKPFIAVCPNNRSARIVELTSRYSLEDRVITSETILDTEEILSRRIDYDRVHSLLNRDIADCKGFLRRALNNYCGNMLAETQPSRMHHADGPVCSEV